MIKNAIKIIVGGSMLTGAAAAFGHVVLDQPVALGGTSYRATLRVGHGCEGSPTHTVRVTLPDGFRGAKPMPHPGWTVAIRREKLARPYTSHGREVTEDVVEVTWTAQSREHWLADAHYDEFVLRGSLPEAATAMWFKVLQICEKGNLDWSEIPASGTSTKGLKAPAALLEVLPSGPAGHAAHAH